MRAPGYSTSTLETRATRYEDGVARASREVLAEETPVTLAYNGVPYAVMMATPSHLEEFALGFSLTEGLIADARELSSVQVVRHARAIELQVETSAAIAASARERRMAGRTGCGLCGTDDVAHVLRGLPRSTSESRFSPSAISRAIASLGASQPLNDSTGGVHAAALAHPDGSVLLIREDVGRHNALDKLVGAARMAQIDASEAFVVLTSRGSFELVQKAAVLGAPLLVTMSAPTGLAVRVAEDAGITLAGFARDQRFTVYTGAERIVA